MSMIPACFSCLYLYCYTENSSKRDQVLSKESNLDKYAPESSSNEQVIVIHEE